MNRISKVLRPRGYRAARPIAALTGQRGLPMRAAELTSGARRRYRLANTNLDYIVAQLVDCAACAGTADGRRSS